MIPAVPDTDRYTDPGAEQPRRVPASPTSATRPDFQLILLDFDRSWSCKRLFSLTRVAGKRL